MKKLIRDIHLYLSLVTGAVILVVCFTGAVLVFEKEWQQTLYPERYKVQAGTTRVSLDQLEATVKQQIPGAKVTGVKVYSDPTRTVELSYSAKPAEKGQGPEKAREEKAADKKAETGKGGKEGKSEKGKKGGKGPSTIAFMNPYTGELINTYEHRHSFFFTMFRLHRWLLVEEPGKLIVGISTSVFLFILLTGIILWWPKNAKMLRNRLTMRLDAGWKRINHDAHIVIGFYTALFLFVFAFTGLAWSFEWFNDAIYTLTGTENKRPEAPKVELAENANTIGYDAAYRTASTQMPAAEFYNLSKPKEAGEAFTVTVMPTDAAHERASDQLYLHPETAELMGTNRFADRNLGQRIRATFYPVHVGSIGGLPGRVIAFLACIAGVTFPITGVILWLNRLKKKKKKSKKARILKPAGASV